LSIQSSPAVTSTRGDGPHPLIRAVLVLGLLFFFLLGVNGLGAGFKSLGHGVLETFFAATENPFTALMVGILATTLVQSSSVSTALIVGLVAAPENPLPIANAVPMIMGANIGTTVTNTVVSLGHIARPDEFRRAFPVATCHDFFNFMAVAILLPLEMMTGFLRHSAEFLAGFVTDFGGMHYQSPVKGALKAGLQPVQELFAAIAPPGRIQAVLLIVFSISLILVALMLLVRVMRAATESRVESLVSRGLGQPAILSMFVGVIVTVMVQSSSITTSLLIPLAGAGVITLPQAFPITIGANIGTTITALLAALAVTGVNAEAGITIALVHLIFNVTATAMIYPVRRIRMLPIRAAQWLGEAAVESRRWAVFYVVVLFYLVPALFAALDQMLG
jgi:sodium-dependent phosphate cotransporter